MDAHQALVHSWIAAENRMAAYVKERGSWRDLVTENPKASKTDIVDAAYYQNLHEQNVHYQTNNWLVPFADFLAAQPIKSLCELGTGNGRFARQMSERLEQIYALDWARSPALEGLPNNVKFIQQNLTGGSFPNADLICSADVLEHFSPDGVESMITRAAKASPKQFHVVACYDDGHSHFTVMSPAAWLCLFQIIDPGFRIHSLEARRNDPRQIVCSITNL